MVGGGSALGGTGSGSMASGGLAVGGVTVDGGGEEVELVGAVAPAYPANARVLNDIVGCIVCSLGISPCGLSFTRTYSVDPAPPAAGQPSCVDGASAVNCERCGNWLTCGAKRACAVRR